MATLRFVPCPQCGTTVEWTPSSRWRPFCSERCKLIDLGAWATGAYRIPVAPAPESDEAEQDDSTNDDSRRS